MTEILDKVHFSATHYEAEIDLRIKLEPHQLNNDIYANIHSTVSKLLNNKCYLDYGCIMQVKSCHCIQNNDYGRIIGEDRNCGVHFNIKAICEVCNPKPGDILIAHIRQITPEIIKATIDKITFIIKVSGVSDSDFEIGDIVVLKVIQTFFQDQGSDILCLAEYIRKADQDEIQEYIQGKYDLETET